MQKKAKVINSDVDFNALSKKEKNPRVRIRLLALVHVKDGVSYRKIEKMLKITYVSVQNWVNRFAAEGVEGLKDKDVGGKEPYFPKDKEEQLRNLIIERQSEMKGGRLIGIDIQKIVKKQFGVAYHLSSIYELLARINMVCVSSRSKHPKSDPKAQESFKKDFKKKSCRSNTGKC